MDQQNEDIQHRRHWKRCIGWYAYVYAKNNPLSNCSHGGPTDVFEKKIPQNLVIKENGEVCRSYIKLLQMLKHVLRKDQQRAKGLVQESLVARKIYYEPMGLNFSAPSKQKYTQPKDAAKINWTKY